MTEDSHSVAVPIPLTAAVLVVSTSAAQGLAADTTGRTIRAWLEGRGFHVQPPLLVADGPAVGAVLRAELGRDHAVIITTGGTGIARDDSTPEQTAPLLDVQLPGLMEALRRAGEATSSRALLTRGVAGFAGATFVMNLPGSPSGVDDGLAVLDRVFGHLLDQRAGGSGHSHTHR